MLLFLPLLIPALLVALGVGGAIVLLVELIESSLYYTKPELHVLTIRPGAYMLYDGEKNIIHVGGTGCLKKRINNHEKYERMRYFRFYETSSEKEAFELEAELQKKYNYVGR